MKFIHSTKLGEDVLYTNCLYYNKDVKIELAIYSTTEDTIVDIPKLYLQVGRIKTYN